MLQAIRADRLQHQQTPLIALLLLWLEQALLYEGRGHLHDGRDHIAWSRAHVLRCFQRAATHEDGKSPEEALLLSQEQPIAPGDGVAQRLLESWHIRSSARQHVKRLLQAGEQRTR